MYESYYRFVKSPFRLVADPSMLFVSESAREGLTRLEYAVRDGKGIVVMTGEVGTGKTTLVNRCLDEARGDVRTAYLFNPSLSGAQLLRALADELHCQVQGESKLELTRALYDDLLRHRQAGRRTVLFVDEAQVLSPEALEELRLLTNLETRHEKLLHIVLVAQPELLALLESHSLRQLRQRVELFIHLGPLTREETGQYIAHRLNMANPGRPVAFTSEAALVIHRLTRGVPRDINKICDASLLIAFVEETGTVTTKHVREAMRTVDAREMGLRLRGTRPSGPWQRLWVGAGAVVGIGAVVFATYMGTRPARSNVGRSPSLAGIASAASAEQPTPQTMQPSTQGMQPAANAKILVHLASYQERREAEDFARSLKLPPGRRLYLQSALSHGREWTRVLVGDFTDAAEAGEFARDGLAKRDYAYAQAVRVPANGLEIWESP
ncbi:MAG TPA: AAA family ATPase [Candidatus Krumholzibacteria bacterium]|nr:AAA family ATPase [Candidatus Krumholzibacteria bacterium]